jgi:COMM domain containing 7
MASTTEMDQQLAADFVNFKALDATQVGGLTDLLLNFLVDGRGDFQVGLSAFAESNKVDTKALKVLVRGMLLFLQNGIREGWNASQLENRCVTLGIDAKVIAVIVDRWQQSSTQMVASILSRTVGANRLIDMDWSFGVTASTDDCDQVGKTFLQLKLTLENGGREGGHSVHFLELSLDQFYHLIGTLEFVASFLHGAENC